MMNRTGILLVFSIIILFASAGIYWQKRHGRQTHPSDLVILNVLDAELYDDCRIPGSINLTLDLLSKEWCNNHMHLDAEIVVYCSNYYCSTSEYVARKLKEFGYSKVSVYEGGMAEWYQQGYPVEGPHKQSYLSSVISPIHDENMEINTISLKELACKLNVTKHVEAV